MRIVDLEKLLPEDLPEGEEIVWRGRPEAIGLARRAFRADIVAAWFGVMATWNTISAAYDFGWRQAALQGTRTLAIGFAALALLFLFGHIAARTGHYVVTSRRIILKVGMALPIFFNIPFAEITEAAVHIHPDDTGDVVLTLHPERRIAYVHLWPHARPFAFAVPQPMLRCIRDGADVAEIIRKALVANASVAGTSTSSSTAVARMKDIAEAPGRTIAGQPIVA